MGLTSNNVSYALSGDFIGYWKYFQSTGEWGKVPGWAIGDVAESRSDDIATGERLYGFFPMASEVVLLPGQVAAEFFMDESPHRADLPALYNQYLRTQSKPELPNPLEDERCLLFPLFVTSYVLHYYLIDHDFFVAEQIAIGSVSSKTGFGQTSRWTLEMSQNTTAVLEADDPALFKALIKRPEVACPTIMPLLIACAIFGISTFAYVESALPTRQGGKRAAQFPKRFQKLAGSSLDSINYP